MSKIGKIAITIPDKVKVAINGGILNIDGPKGKKSLNIDTDIFDLDIKEGKEIHIKPKKIDKKVKRLWGMNRSLVNNAIIGADKGYEKTLELVGVGYRAALQGNILKLSLGYSHDIDFEVPESVKITVPKPTEIIINGIDQQIVGQVAANIREKRKPEPYKGKGIRYKDEYVFAKEGKKK